MIKKKFIFIFLLIINFSFFTKSYANLNEKNIMISNKSTIYDEDYYDLDYEPSDIKNSDIWDPFERMNRKTYKFNDFLLKNVAKPFYYNFYLKVTNKATRKGVNNFVTNLKMPLNFFNYALQLDFENSSGSLYSFIINSTYGIFGIFDVASKQDINISKTNFGITLAKYDIPAGPYIILPFLGPNDLRGIASLGFETAIDPFSMNMLNIGNNSAILNRDQLLVKSSLIALDDITFVMENFYDLLEISFDPYVITRDAYKQSQKYKINNLKGK